MRPVPEPDQPQYDPRGDHVHNLIAIADDIGAMSMEEYASRRSEIMRGMEKVPTERKIAALWPDRKAVS